MGERKVLNKYFPPDFDPSKMPKMKRVRSEDKQMKVRMMLPMTVRCNVCGTFMYKGTKFNTRMEDVRGETYLGIKIFRFYYRCTHCSAEFCMKTDPKNADYELEAGATRNYEPWRDKETAAAVAVAEREEEERGNAMKALENRTIDSKREMDILNALDEMKSLKARHEQVDTEAALAALKRSAQQEGEVELDEEDEAAVRQMLLQRAGFVRRLSDSDEEEAPRGQGPAAGGGSGAGAGPSSARPPIAPRMRGATVAPAAAALWEEELSEASEDTGIDGDAFMQQQFAAARAAAVAGGDAGEAAVQARGGSAAQEAEQQGGSAAAAPVQQQQQREQQREQQRGVPPKPKPAEKPPPALPKFAVRPVAVVVKRKADSEAEGAKPGKQQPAATAAGGEDSEGSGGGMGALLACYGSSSGADSP